MLAQGHSRSSGRAQGRIPSGSPQPCCTSDQRQGKPCSRVTATPSPVLCLLHLKDPLSCVSHFLCLSSLTCPHCQMLWCELRSQLHPS